jgi:hypothetical protein
VNVPALIVSSVVVFAAATFGDAAVGAGLAGLFSVVNTVLLWQLGRGHKELKEAITSDRRIIYDADGKPIGTVLDLRTGEGWDQWRTQAGRRHDDQHQ